MKQIILNITLLLLFALIFFSAGWLTEFWNSPMGEPLCVARGGDALTPLLAQLQSGYKVFWIAAALPFLAVFAWCGISLHRLAELRRG